MYKKFIGKDGKLAVRAETSDKYGMNSIRISDGSNEISLGIYTEDNLADIDSLVECLKEFRTKAKENLKKTSKTRGY